MFPSPPLETKIASKNWWHRRHVNLYGSSSWQSRRAWTVIWPQPCLQTRSWGAQKRWREQARPPHWTWTWWEKGHGWIPWDSSRHDWSSWSWISCCWFWLLRWRRRTRNLGFRFLGSRIFWRLCRLKSRGICRSWCCRWGAWRYFFVLFWFRGTMFPLKFFFLDYFILILNLYIKKKQKKQNGVVLGVLTTTTNWVVMEPCIEKNWKLEDRIDKTKS